MYSNQTTMNSGTYSTELNDMLTNFVEYVDSFYGVNDPLYPLIKEGKPLSKVDILGATEKYLGQCADAVSYTHLRAHETYADLVCRLLCLPSS